MSPKLPVELLHDILDLAMEDAPQDVKTGLCLLSKSLATTAHASLYRDLSIKLDDEDGNWDDYMEIQSTRIPFPQSVLGTLLGQPRLATLVRTLSLFLDAHPDPSLLESHLRHMFQACSKLRRLDLYASYRGRRILGRAAADLHLKLDTLDIQTFGQELIPLLASLHGLKTLILHHLSHTLPADCLACQLPFALTSFELHGWNQDHTAFSAIFLASSSSLRRLTLHYTHVAQLAPNPKSLASFAELSYLRINFNNWVAASDMESLLPYIHAPLHPCSSLPPSPPSHRGSRRRRG
jgi:hypothetical protein